MPVSLPLALLLALAPPSGSVAIDRDTWRALHPPGPAEVTIPAWAHARDVSLTAVPGGLELRATWVLRSLSKGAWFSGQVLGAIPGMRVEKVAWDGQPVAVRARPDGVTIAGRVSGRAVLELVAFVPGEPTREPLALALLPAVRGHVVVTAPAGLVADLRAVGPKIDEAQRTDEPADALRLGANFWTGAARLDLAFVAAPSSPTSRATVVVARAGVGLTVGDAELRGHARLVWEVRQGTLDAVAFTATGVGPDLEIQGPGVRDVQRSGDGVRVDLQAPVAGRLELDATWSLPVAKSAESRADLPQFSFADVFRSESALQLARDGEVEAVPTPTGWTPTTAAALPAWAQGLVEGTPTAAFRGSAAPAGHLDLLRFVPLEGPPVVVDVAAYTIATSREGRALMRAHYEVRNERAASLRVRPPPGFEVLGVRVGGATATPARDRDGAWRIPLQRSVETVSGLLSFPVEIALLGGDDDAWRRRERRPLALPVLDAPVAVARVTLHLPPGYRSRLDPGDGDVVAGFTRGDGITYGLGVGAVGAAEADAVFQSAVKNWLANDFGAAQADLDRLKSIGARNENIDRLQGNLDVIAGRGGDKDDGNVQRRIREQAKARSITDQKLQDELRTKAEESRKSGDYEAADSQYRAAIEVGDRLAKLEQKESVEQDARNQVLEQERVSNVAEFKARKKTRAPARTRKIVFGKGSAANTTPERDDDDTLSTPVGGTSRDFTAVLDVVPGVARDGKRGETRKPESPPPQPAPPTGDASVAVAGTTSSESTYTIDGASVKTPPPANRPTGGEGEAAEATAPVETTPTAATTPVTDDRMVKQAESLNISVESRGSPLANMPGVVQARGLRGRIGRGLRRLGAGAVATESAASPGPSTPPKPAEEQPADAPAPALAGLPTPVATASAVSVVVPQLGRPVLYQRLLLPADAAYAIAIDAREPLIAKD